MSKPVESAKLEELLVKVAKLEAELSSANKMIAEKERLIGKLEQAVEESRQSKKEIQALQNDMARNLEEARSRTEQLLTYQALPWWQRMKSRHLLTG